MNRFIVGIEDLPKEQEESFLSYLEKHGAGWWHLINNFWLISSNDSNVSISSIREELTKNFKGLVIVLDANNNEPWGGYGSESDFKWLKSNWDKE